MHDGSGTTSKPLHSGRDELSDRFRNVAVHGSGAGNNNSVGYLGNLTIIGRIPIEIESNR